MIKPVEREKKKKIENKRRVLRQFDFLASIPSTLP